MANGIATQSEPNLSLAAQLTPVGVAGAVGGLIWWLLSVRAGDPPLISVLVAPMAAALLGTTAAFVFVFLVANTDRDDRPRLLALSLAAGMAWDPALDAGTAVVRQEREVRQVAQATKAVEEVQRLAAEDAGAADGAAGAIAAKLDEVAARAYAVDSIAAIEEIREASRPAITAAEPLANESTEVRAALRRLNDRFRAVDRVTALPAAAATDAVE